MLFPVKREHIGFDWYAPLCVNFGHYSNFAILPPTAPSPLAANTLKQVVPFTPITDKNLKRTPTARIRTDLALHSPHFGEFLPAFREMLDPVGFEACLIAPEFLSTRPVYSRHLLRHWPIMLQDGIAEECAIEDLRDISVWFGVASSNDEFRLVQNLKRLKQGFTRPLTMGLSRIHDFGLRLLQWRNGYLFQEDAKSYFYTFEIPPAIRKYFGALLVNERGQFKCVRLCVLSQGFVKSPTTAQRFSLGVARESKMNLETNDVELEPWLDNFLGASPDLAVSNTLRRSFQDTCHKYNVTLKPNDASPTQSLDALSLRFSTVDQSMQMSQAFLDNFNAFVNNTDTNHLTRRSFLQIFGRILWVFYALRLSASFFPGLMAQMAEICSHIGEAHRLDGDWWDTEIHLGGEEARELLEACARVNLNPKLFYHELALRPEDAVWAWGDASSYLGAWVVEPFRGSEETFSTVGFDDHLNQIPIFYKELYMSALVIDHLCNLYRDTQILLLGDNQAALHAIAKGHSMNPVTNDMIQWIYRRAAEANNTVFPAWVSTLLMRADALTRMRNQPGPRHPITINVSIPRRGIQAANEIQPFA